MVVGAVIYAGIMLITATEMHFDYYAVLLVMQSSKALQYQDLVSKTKLLLRTFNNYVFHRIASGCMVG